MESASEDLLESLVNGTGLPPEPIKRELNQLIDRLGMKKDELSLEQIRQLVTLYLKDVMLRVPSSHLEPAFTPQERLN